MPRTTIEFSDAADQALEGIKTRVSASSKAEIVRNALSLYVYVVEELNARPECELAIARRSDNQVVKAVIVPGIARATVAYGD